MPVAIKSACPPCKRVLRLAMAALAGFASSAQAEDLTPTITVRGDGKTVATFSTVGTGTWTIPAVISSVEVLVVGGGGSGAAGGTWNATGGGAGGLYQSSSYAVTGGGSVTVTVGAGGAALADYGAGNAGSDSAFDALISYGGGGGLQANGPGGASGGNNQGGTGFAGISGGGSSGGSGAGGQGVSNWGDSYGGIGVQNSITGTATYYGGGGGGGYSGANNAGGLGGGGKGATEGEAGFGHDALNGTGGGGGASRDNAISGAGGSGVVIVAYDSGVTMWTVQFESNGGSAVSNEFVADGNFATEPAPPTWTGHTFVEWCSDSPPITPFDFDTAITADRTLYAKWTINSYTLTYSAAANGSLEGGSPQTQTVEYLGSGTAVLAKADTGYQFLKWSDGKTANPRTDSNVASNIIVEAIFELIPGPVTPDTTVVRGDGKTVATFSTAGKGIWTIPDGVTTVEVLVVGGGGGGGRKGGGGGGGGFYWTTSYTPSGGLVNVTVGAGGIGDIGNNTRTAGSQSVFDTLIAYGGGIGDPSGTTRGGASGGNNQGDAGILGTPTSGAGGAGAGPGSGDGGAGGGWQNLYGGNGKTRYHR